MSLWPVGDPVAPCLDYQAYDGSPLPWVHYNEWLVAPPRRYVESIQGFRHFFYEPGSDRLVAYGNLSYLYWPSWEAACFWWDAQTGAYLGRGPAGIITLAWTNNAGVGSYGKIYTRAVVWLIQSVAWDTLTYDGGFQVDMGQWNPNPMFGYALVNQDDKLIVGVGNWFLDVWSYDGTPMSKGQLRLPDVLGYLAYQDRDNCWVITRGGLIAKCNYKKLRWEMLSSVQNPSPDATNYLCAFDTRRSRLAVLRQRPDAADGACQCQLEFYRPLSRTTIITDPVPVTTLRAGGKVRFAAHLLGDGGEGLTGAKVSAQLIAPGHGQVLTPVAPAQQGGALAFDYNAQASGTDTLQLSAAIEDGYL